MKKLLSAFLLTALLSLSAYAGFEARNTTSNLKLFTGISCDQGLTCVRAKGGFLSMKPSGSGVQSSIVPATATTATAAQCGSTFVNSAAVEIDLPDAALVPGCKYTFVTLNASNFDIDPDAADIILVNTDAVGDRLRNATVGNTVTIQAVSASQWAIVGILGTWADAN